MRIVVTGATGLIGRNLVAKLVANGDSVAVLTRNSSKATTVFPPDVDIYQWDYNSDSFPLESLNASDAIVHLIGEPIKGRWTQSKKLQILQSRVDSTKSLVTALTTLNNPPLKVIMASAVGYYGDRGDEELTDSSIRGEGFLADVSEAWENASHPLTNAGISVIPLRLGLVLSSQGGALKELLLPWSLGLGTKIGDGSQWWPWIHIEDVVGLIDYALKGHIANGPINAVAPESVTQLQFAKELARVLHRPQILRVPKPILRALLGEVSWELTASRRAINTETGYVYRYPALKLALQNLLSDREIKRNGMRRYQTEMWVDAPIDKVFAFFSDPANLEQITPPWLKFKMLTTERLSIGRGTIIDYRLRLHGIPITWKSEITEWNPPNNFIDVQKKGPYRYWAHTHEFIESGTGTFVRDSVDYKVPGGYLVDRLLVRKDIERIFTYRKSKLRELMTAQPVDQ